MLRNSESLCKLLRYLADFALEAPGAGLKEYQIATEVFGRPRDFDPRLDSTVRVQTGRLRSKLAEYYSGAGAEDPIVVELPKGAYALQIRSKPIAEPAAGPPAQPQPPAEQTAHAEVRTGVRWVTPVLAGLCLALAAALVAVLVFRGRPAGPAEGVADAPLPLRTFWADFIDSVDRPLVVFSNAEFIGRPETGIKYFDPASDARDRILDHYTGVGEVIAVHEIDNLFVSLRHGIRVKRGRLLSIDDAKKADVIFVGSPSENLASREVATTHDFVFRVAAEGPRRGDLGVFNTRPAAGEADVYFSNGDMPLTEDYAVIGILPGLDPSVRVMLLAGTTTIGTQAAAEFVTRARDVEELLRRLSVNGKVPPFEALLRVSVNKGVPVGTEIVAVHKR